jgi:hypothetical protein
VRVVGRGGVGWGGGGDYSRLGFCGNQF